jgi:hypothetical protein
MATTNKTGRPSDYKPKFAEEARKQCEEGATDQELADYFEVSVRTLYRWKNKHPEFCQALKVSKATADERVERSLFERAIGYERDEVDIRVVGGEIVQTPVRKFYPPDTTAAIFWLKNRRPDEWRDRVQTELTGANGGPVQIVASNHDEAL